MPRHRRSTILCSNRHYFAKIIQRLDVASNPRPHLLIRRDCDIHQPEHGMTTADADIAIICLKLATTADRFQGEVETIPHRFTVPPTLTMKENPSSTGSPEPQY